MPWAPLIFKYLSTLGEISEFLGKKWDGKLMILTLLSVKCFQYIVCLSTCDESKKLNTLEPSFITYKSATPSTYPIYLLYHFLFFIRVHLDWKTLLNLIFLLHGKSIYFYTYYIQGLRLNCWAPFINSTYLLIYQD